jgi:hypothetical protein
VDVDVEVGPGSRPEPHAERRTEQARVVITRVFLDFIPSPQLLWICRLLGLRRGFYQPTKTLSDSAAGKSAGSSYQEIR